ncbi:HAD family hydrolase [Thermoanaerobacterium thermosaccharolyticum]|uniref:HAD family hydrolase n=1 Tax=Thermoanaerobacterium thermosaccharolyticum TaxID=1517 RepID=UPI003D27624D
MIIDAIMFDLDGTLWDPTEIILKCLNDTVKEKKEISKTFTKREVESIMGLTIEETAETLFPNLDIKTGISIVEQCYIQENIWIKKSGGHIYKNTEEVIKKLSEKYLLFIISNCQCDYIESFLEYYRLRSYFKDFLSFGITGLPKSDNIKIMIKK